MITCMVLTIGLDLYFIRFSPRDQRESFISFPFQKDLCLREKKTPAQQIENINRNILLTMIHINIQNVKVK